MSIERNTSLSGTEGHSITTRAEGRLNTDSLNYTRNENVQEILAESTSKEAGPTLIHRFSPKMTFSRIKRSPESRAKHKKLHKRRKSGKRKLSTKKGKQNKDKVTYMKYKAPDASKHKSNRKFKKYKYKNNNQKRRKSPRKKSHMENEDTYLDSADFNEIFEMIKRKVPKVDKFWIKIKENSDEQKDIPKNLNSLGYNSTELHSGESNSSIGNTNAITNNSNRYFNKNVTNHDEIENRIINSAQSRIPLKIFGNSNISSITSERKKFSHKNSVDKENIYELTTVESRDKFPIINPEKVSTDFRNVKDVMDTSNKNLPAANNVSKINNQSKLQTLEINESPVNQISGNFDKITVWKNSVKNISTFNGFNSETKATPESTAHPTNENRKHSGTEDISITTLRYDFNSVNTLHKIPHSINSSRVVLKENHEEHHSEDLNKIPHFESITKTATETTNTLVEFSKAWNYSKPKTEKNLNKSSKTNILENEVFKMTPSRLSSLDESDSFVGTHAFLENEIDTDFKDNLPEISRKLHNDVGKKYTNNKHSYKFYVKPDNLTTNRIKNDTIYKAGRERNEETSSEKVIPSIRFYNHDSPMKQTIPNDFINNKDFKTDLKNDSKLQGEDNSLKYAVNDQIWVITTNPNKTKILRYVSQEDLFVPNKTTELGKNNSNEDDSMPQLSKSHIFSDHINSSSQFMPIKFEDGQMQETSIDPNLNTPPASKTPLKKSYKFEEVSSSTNMIINDYNASRNDVLNDLKNLHVFSHNTGPFNTVSINDSFIQDTYQNISQTDSHEIINSDAKSIDETVEQKNNSENGATPVLPTPVFNELRDSKSLILKMFTNGNNSFDNYAEPSDKLSNDLNYENSIRGRNISNLFHHYNKPEYVSEKRFNELHDIREADILANKMSQVGENTNDTTISSKYPAIPTRLHKSTPNPIQKNLGDKYFTEGLSTLPNPSTHEFKTQSDEFYFEPSNFTTNNSTVTPDKIHEFKEIANSKNMIAEEEKKIGTTTTSETSFTPLNVSSESDSSFMNEVPNSKYHKNSKEYSSKIMKNLERSISPDDKFNKQIKTIHVIQSNNTTTMSIIPIDDIYEAEKTIVLKNETVIEENFKNEVSSVNSFSETKPISDNKAPSTHISTSIKGKNSSGDTVSLSQELHTIRSNPYQANRIEETYKKDHANKTLEVRTEGTLPTLEESYKNGFLAIQNMHLPKNTTYLRVIESYLPDNQEILLANFSGNATGMKGSNTSVVVSDGSTEETFTIVTDNMFKNSNEIIIINSDKLENNAEFEESSRTNNSATYEVKGLDFVTTEDVLPSKYNLQAENHIPGYLFRNHEQLKNHSNFINDTVSKEEQITNKPLNVFYEIREVIISPTRHVKKETNAENEFSTTTHFTKFDSLISPTKIVKKETNTENEFTTAIHFTKFDSLNHSDFLNLQEISSFDKINNSNVGSTGLLKQMHSNVSPTDKIRKNDNITDLMINNGNTKQFSDTQIAEIYTSTQTFIPVNKDITENTNSKIKYAYNSVPSVLLLKKPNFDPLQINSFENQGNASTPIGNNPISKNTFSLNNHEIKNSPVRITPELSDLFDKNSSNINFFDNKLEQANARKNEVTVQQIPDAPVSIREKLYNKNPLTISEITLSTNNAEFQGVSEENSKGIQNNLPDQVFATELGNTTNTKNSETKQNFEQPFSRIFMVKEILVNSNKIVDPGNKIDISPKNSTLHYDRPFNKSLPIVDTNKTSLDEVDNYDMEPSSDKSEIYYKMRKIIFSPNNITKQENNSEEVNTFNINVNQADQIHSLDSLIKSKTHITSVYAKDDKTSTESLDLHPAISTSRAVTRKNNLVTEGILHTTLNTPDIFDDSGFRSHNNVTYFNKKASSGSVSVFSDDEINDVLNEVSLNKATISPDVDATSSNSTSLKSVNRNHKVSLNKTMLEENNTINDSRFPITESYQLYDRNSTFLKRAFVSTNKNNFPESSTVLSNVILNGGMTSESLDNNILNTTDIFFSEIHFSNVSKENVILLNDSVDLKNQTENTRILNTPDVDATSLNSTSLKSVNRNRKVPLNKTMVGENNTINDFESRFPFTESYQLYDGNSIFLKRAFVSTNKNNFPESSTVLSNLILNGGMTSESLDNNILNTTDIFFSEVLFSNVSKENVILLNDSVDLESKTENTHFSNIPSVTVYENTFSLRTNDGNDIISFPAGENTINQTSRTNTSFFLSGIKRKNEDFEKENKDLYKTNEDSEKNTESENFPTKFVLLESKTFDYLFNNFNETTLDSQDILLSMLNNNASNNPSKEQSIKEIFPADFSQKEIIDAQRTESNVSKVTRVITEIPSATYYREHAFDLQENIVFKNRKRNATFINMHNDNATHIFTKEMLDVNETRNNILNTSSPSLFLGTYVNDKNRSISDPDTYIRFTVIINNKVTDGSENIKNIWHRLNEGKDIPESKNSLITLTNKRMENNNTSSFKNAQNNRMSSSPELKINPNFEQKPAVRGHETKPDERKNYVENDYFIKSNKKLDKVKYDAVFMITNNFNVKNNQESDYFGKDGDKMIKNQEFHPNSIGINQLYPKKGYGDRYFNVKPHIETQKSEPKQIIKDIKAELMLKNNNDKTKTRKGIFVVPRCFSGAFRLEDKFNEDGDETDNIRNKHANQINIRTTEFEDKYSQNSSPSNPLQNEMDFRTNQFVSKRKNTDMSSGLGAINKNATTTKSKPLFFRRYPIFHRKLNEPHVKSVNNRMSYSVSKPANNPVILILFADKMISTHKNPLNTNDKEADYTKFYKFLQNKDGGYTPSGERYGKYWLWTNAEHRERINIHVSPAVSKLSSISIEPQQFNDVPENYEVPDMANTHNFFPEKQRQLNQWINYEKFSRRNKRDLNQFNTFKNKPLFSSSRTENEKTNVDEYVSEKINDCPECLDVNKNSESKTNFLGSKFQLEDELYETGRNDGGETISETIKNDFSENVKEIGDNSKFQSIIVDKNVNFGPHEEQVRKPYNNAEDSLSHKLADRFIDFLNDKTTSRTPVPASYLKDNHWTNGFRSKTRRNKDHMETMKTAITDEVKDSQSDFTSANQNIGLKKEMFPTEDTDFELSDDRNPDTINDKEEEHDLKFSDDKNANSMKDKGEEYDLELSDYENENTMTDKEKEQFWKLFLPFLQSMNKTNDSK